MITIKTISGEILLTLNSLTGADLYRANLTRANLTGANLSGANLSGADLSGANLSGTGVRFCKLGEFIVCINGDTVHIGCQTYQRSDLDQPGSKLSEAMQIDPSARAWWNQFGQRVMDMLGE